MQWTIANVSRVILTMDQHLDPLSTPVMKQVVEHWTFSLFFCIAELWGSVVISVLFWTLANDVCTVADAKTIYPLMGIAANIALVVAGNYMKWVNRGVAGGSLAVSLQVLARNRWLRRGSAHHDAKSSAPRRKPYLLIPCP